MVQQFDCSLLLSDDCSLSKNSLPEEIGSLGSLVILSLGYSAIRLLPPSTGRLQSLKELDLGYI